MFSNLPDIEPLINLAFWSFVVAVLLAGYELVRLAIWLWQHVHIS